MSAVGRAVGRQVGRYVSRYVGRSAACRDVQQQIHFSDVKCLGLVLGSSPDPAVISLVQALVQVITHPNAACSSCSSPHAEGCHTYPVAHKTSSQVLSRA